MSKLLHALGHGVILVLNAALLYNGYVPPKYAPLAVAIQGLAHALLGLYNHKNGA